MDSTVLIKPLLGCYKTGTWQSIKDVITTKDNIDEIHLRGWQAEILDQRINSKEPHLFINCPTGAGKSKAALAIITQEEKNTDKLVIISAPQKEIGKGFLSSKGNPQKILGHTYRIVPEYQLCEETVINEDGNINTLFKFLQKKRNPDLNQRILICCHATLALLFDRISEDDKKNYLKGIKLCIDESHHSLSQEDAGNGLGSVVNYFLKNSSDNLDLVMMTATPFRGDKGTLIPDSYLKDFCRYDLDYGRHFEENCAGLEFTYNAVLHQYGDSYGKVIEDLMEKYLSQGDKVLIQIPPSNASISNGKFNDLQMIYDSIGKKQVIDPTTGVVVIEHKGELVVVVDLVTEKDREKRLDYLRNNRDNVDVVIGISMIKEGFDWPPANVGILIGSQGSLNAQIQLMGRMFRAYNNKGKDNGKKPVEINQIFPYVDHEKLDEDEVREQINTFMKIVYAALAMELVINPIHIDIPIKTEAGEQKTISVKNYLLDNLTDVQYTELMSDVMDDFRDWKANNPDVETNNSEKIAEIVSEKLTELGIDENHDKIAEFFNKTLQRSARFQLAAIQGIDVSHIDVDLMKDIEDPIDSILMGMSNGLCGASDIKEFQLLMKPIDTLRRCYELKEWVDKNGRFPSTYSKDKYEKSLGMFKQTMRQAKRGKNKHNFTENHIEILESIPNWEWEDDKTKTLKRCYELKNWVIENKKTPSGNTDDKYEKSLWRFVGSMRKSYKKIGTYNLTDEMVKLLQSIPNWEWDSKDKTIKRCKELKKWVIKNNRFPYYSSKDLEEKRLGQFISSVKRSIKGKGSYNLTNEIIEILESIPNWKWDNISKTIDRCYELKEWVEKNGRFPNKRSNDREEKFLGQYLQNIKQARKGNTERKITEEMTQILESISNWKW